MNYVFSPDVSPSFARIVRATVAIDGMVLAAACDDGSIGDDELIMMLSEPERDTAKLMIEASERRHFRFRRSFQRMFVHGMLGSEGSIDAVSLVHQRDQRPLCASKPSLNLSFSSSGPAVLACASEQRSIGIDIERMRPIANVVGLAQRFFSAREAAGIASLPVSRQSLVFLQHWTAKEAGLKALGRGIDWGLNRVTLAPKADGYTIELQREPTDSAQWNLTHPDILQDHVVAVVHRPVEYLTLS